MAVPTMCPKAPKGNLINHYTDMAEDDVRCGWCGIDKPESKDLDVREIAAPEDMKEQRLLGLEAKKNSESSRERTNNINAGKAKKDGVPHAGSRAVSYSDKAPSVKNDSVVIGEARYVTVYPRTQYYSPESADAVERVYTGFIEHSACRFSIRNMEVRSIDQFITAYLIPASRTWKKQFVGDEEYTRRWISPQMTGKAANPVPSLISRAAEDCKYVFDLLREFTGTGSTGKPKEPVIYLICEKPSKGDDTTGSMKDSLTLAREEIKHLEQQVCNLEQELQESEDQCLEQETQVKSYRRQLANTKKQLPVRSASRPITIDEDNENDGVKEEFKGVVKEEDEESIKEEEEEKLKSELDSGDDDLGELFTDGPLPRGQRKRPSSEVSPITKKEATKKARAAGNKKNASRGKKANKRTADK